LLDESSRAYKIVAGPRIQTNIAATGFGSNVHQSNRVHVYNKHASIPKFLPMSFSVIFQLPWLIQALSARLKAPRLDCGSSCASSHRRGLVQNRGFNNPHVFE
jgi:hypothetical protein